MQNNNDLIFKLKDSTGQWHTEQCSAIILHVIQIDEKGNGYETLKSEGQHGRLSDSQIFNSWLYMAAYLSKSKEVTVFQGQICTMVMMALQEANEKAKEQH